MSRGNPPELPSLKHPEWLTNLIAAFPRRLDLHVKYAFQYAAQVEYERAFRNANPVAIAPMGASIAEKYDHYRRMVEARGFKLNPDGPTVLALRGVSSDGLSHSTESAAAYDDTLVVLTRDAQGEPHVRLFSGSTHPGQSRASIGGKTGVPDVGSPDGDVPDDAADVGIIIAGEYDLAPRGEHNGAAAWSVRQGDSGALPGFRDTDHDGQYSAAERAASERRDDTLTGVMIHQGSANHPESVGCLNLSSDDYSHFVEAVGGARQPGKLIVLDGDEAFQ